MPLIKSPSKSAVKKNIAKEVESGKPPKQAVAIALSTQDRAKKSKDDDYKPKPKLGRPPKRFMRY